MSLVVGTNTWGTLVEAEAYFKTRYGSSKFWNTELPQQDKEAALATAWNHLFGSGLFELSVTDESATMKQAQFEMALFLIQHLGDMDARMGLQAQGVIQAGIVQETYDRARVGLPVPANVMALLANSQISSLGFGTAKITRTDGL